MKKDSEYYELAETIVNSLNDVQVDTQEAISIVAHVLYEKDLSQTQEDNKMVEALKKIKELAYQETHCQRTIIGIRNLTEQALSKERSKK